MADQPDQPDADCSEAIQDLYLFLDEEDTPALRARIRRHLDGCGGCLEAFEFESDLRSYVASCCQEEPPDGLRDRIAVALEDLEHS